MDEMNMGTPWLDKPYSETYRMYECSLNDTALCKYQEGYWRFWYEADHRYALSTVAFFLAAIVLFSMGYLADTLISQSMRRSKGVRKVVALNRFLSYKTYRINGLNWNSAPLGILALGGVGLIYFTTMTLAPKPYYWPNIAKFGNSPPIATRSGWLSLACLPFVFATAGKSNLITLVTGVSHEKLQVFHRWISYAFFVTALIHTFPFIVYNISQGTMVESWNTSVFYWTGTVVLVAQAWLTFASLGPLRSLSYEWFKFSHFVAALVFTLFLFFHCDHTLSSWDYFIATGVLFSLSWLHRQIRSYFEHGVNHKANISLLPNDFVCVRVPTNSAWRIGQHFFVRFMGLGVHASTNHPFTACSLPAPAARRTSTQSELVFYIRPRGGTTARLAHYAKQHPNKPMRVMLDGPFGGIDMQRIVRYQHQLIVAGGSAAGWILPLLSAFLHRQGPTDKLEHAAMSPAQMRIILATKDVATREWFKEAVSELLTEHELDRMPPGLAIELYFTGHDANGSVIPQLSELLPEKTPAPQETILSRSSSSSSPQPSSVSSKSLASAQHFTHRPDLPVLIKAEVAHSSSQLSVFVCGPLSMQSDVANAVAEEQVRILRGGDEGAAKDVYLHVEHFSWA